MTVIAVFFLNGLTLSTYIVRAPSFKSAYQLTDGQVGLSGLLFALAALGCMQLVGPLMARVGTRAVLRCTLAVMPVLLAGLAVAPGAWWFTAGAAVLGAVHGTTDAAMNATAVAVEQRGGRPIMNSCHAGWSVSAVVASLATAALAHAGVALTTHLVTAGALLLVAGLALGPRLPAAPVSPAAGVTASPAAGAAARTRAPWTRPLLLLGLTATMLMICEGGALGWGGIFLHDVRHASVSLAAAAITAYTGGQAAGRLFGDRLAVRCGPRLVFRTGAAVAAAGLAAAVLAPAPAVAVAGFALTGLGASVLIPLTYSAVGRLPGADPATFVARMTTFTYTGILLGPALIGWLAEQIGLLSTMTALVPLLVLAAVVSPMDNRRPPSDTAPGVGDEVPIAGRAA